MCKRLPKGCIYRLRQWLGGSKVHSEPSIPAISNHCGTRVKFPESGCRQGKCQGKVTQLNFRICIGFLLHLIML